MGRDQRQPAEVSSEGEAETLVEVNVNDMRLLCVIQGSDRDIAFEHVLVPRDLDIPAAKRRQQTWYKNVYTPAVRARKNLVAESNLTSFASWLVHKEGGDWADETHVEEVWE